MNRDEYYLLDGGDKLLISDDELTVDIIKRNGIVKQYAIINNSKKKCEKVKKQQIYETGLDELVEIMKKLQQRDVLKKYVDDEYDKKSNHAIAVEKLNQSYVDKEIKDHYSKIHLDHDSDSESETYNNHEKKILSDNKYQNKSS